MEATHREHGDKRHQEACCPEEIVWNTLGCQLQDSENCIHGRSPTASKTHTNKLDKVQNIGLRTILVVMKTTPLDETKKTAEAEPLESRRQVKLLIHEEKIKRMSDHPCTKNLKILPPPPPHPPTQKPPTNKQTKRNKTTTTTTTTTTTKQTEKEKLEPSNKRTAERKCRHPYNWCTPLWKFKPKQLTTRNPTSWDQDNHPWHHIEGKPEWSSFKGTGSGRDWQALSNGILDTHLPWWLSWRRHKKEDVMPTSSVQVSLQSPCQHPVGYCAQTIELKS